MLSPLLKLLAMCVMFAVMRFTRLFMGKLICPLWTARVLSVKPIKPEERSSKTTKPPNSSQDKKSVSPKHQTRYLLAQSPDHSTSSLLVNSAESATPETSLLSLVSTFQFKSIPSRVHKEEWFITQKSKLTRSLRRRRNTLSWP